MSTHNFTLILLKKSYYEGCNSRLAFVSYVTTFGFHVWQAMAIKDRVNVESLTLSALENIPLLDVPNDHFVPSPEDMYSMRDDFIHVRLMPLSQ